MKEGGVYVGVLESGYVELKEVFVMGDKGNGFV
jgi:hypothetical protein